MPGLPVTLSIRNKSLYPWENNKKKAVPGGSGNGLRREDREDWRKEKG
jgi:hypothetical protein